MARRSKVGLWYVLSKRNATRKRSPVGESDVQEVEAHPMRTTQQNNSSVGIRRGRKTHQRTPKPLSVVHADALYRPGPPVGYDDDGYPYADEAPVDNQDHKYASSYLLYALREHYASRTDVLVGSEQGVFFEEGNRSALVVPDAFVAFGVDAGSRMSYKLWVESKVPAIAIEVLSTSTWRKDLRAKPGLYEALGILEYWTFDQHRISGGPPLIGRYLVDGAYTVQGGPETGHSAVLGLDLVVEGERLRLHDPATGLDLPYYTEAVGMYREAKARADKEHARAEGEQARAAAQASARHAAERRIAELEEQLRRAKGG